MCKEEEQVDPYVRRCLKIGATFITTVNPTATARVPVAGDVGQDPHELTQCDM